jgi:hypothetical protein
VANGRSCINIIHPCSPWSLVSWKDRSFLISGRFLCFSGVVFSFLTA